MHHTQVPCYHLSVDFQEYSVKMQLQYTQHDMPRMTQQAHLTVQLLDRLYAPRQASF